MNLLIYNVLIIMSNHSETNDQNSIGSLTYSPHLAKYTHRLTENKGRT